MPRIIESDLEGQLRQVDDGSPDYAGMRRRIVLEADKRRSGWTEVKPAAKPYLRRKWTVPAASAVLAGAVATGVILWQPAPGPDKPEQAYGAPAGQSLEASAAVDGVKLTLSNAIVGHSEEESDAPSDRLALQMSLSGLNESEAEYAGFGSGRLIDLDSGETRDMDGASFDLRQGMHDLQAGKMLDNEWAAESGTRRLRFEMDDLYLIRRHDVPLQGTLQTGATYPVPGVEGVSVRMLDSKWDEEQGLLTLTYKLQGADTDADSAYPRSLSIETRTLLRLNSGSNTVESTSGTWAGSEFTVNYELPGLSEQERQALTLTYSYAETVRKIAGSWKMDFTLDASKARERSVKLTPVNAAEIRRQTGWTVGEASVSAYGIRLPIERSPQDRAMQVGSLLFYDKRTVLAGDSEFEEVEQEEASAAGNAGTAESLFFRPLSVDMQNLTTGPLSVKLEQAFVLRQAPDDFWTTLAAPGSEERQASAELPDGSRLTYRYARQGRDLKIVTETRDPLKLVQGTVLSVDGEVRQPDAKSSYSPYRAQGAYRVDVYRSVPQDAELKLGLGLYGQLDPSRDMEIVLRK